VWRRTGGALELVVSELEAHLKHEQEALKKARFEAMDLHTKVTISPAT
jgi:hypothetical protein